MATRKIQNADTTLYKFSDYGERPIGFVDEQGVIYRLRWREGTPIGHADDDGRIFRQTAHDVREVGRIDADGAIRSHGLFEGGALGWLEPDGVVMQGGLILGEEEVGRVDGPHAAIAAAALLLIFIPEDAEADRRAAR